MYVDMQSFEDICLSRLYERGEDKKVEKLKCILNYFHRVAKRSRFSMVYKDKMILFD